jgi:hypothetical protein
MLRRCLTLATTLCVLITGLTGLAASSFAVTPPTPRGLPAGIEPLADYVPQTSCDPTVKPGAAALGALLTATYRGTTFASAYACGTDGTVSEHYEGRALDWMVSVRTGAQAGQARAFLSWLFATDGAGHRYAEARRLGVMYIVFDNRIWGAWDGSWHPHSACASHPEASWDSTCHRNHMHISLSWEAAMKRTSYWTHRVATADYGPCRPSDLNWAAPYRSSNPRPCPDYAAARAPAGSSATMQALVTYSGATVHYGSTGPAVVAVQRALGVSQTGNFLDKTRAAVLAYQKRHGLHVTGDANPETWRALLRTFGPRPAAPTSTSYPAVRLAYGSTGAHVVAVQQRLRVQPVSGWFGPVTRAAVVRFQQSLRLPATGVVDGRTWVTLGLH